MINNNEKRIGRFTSSQIYRLCGTLKSGLPAASVQTYIDEVKISRQLGRSVKTQVKTQPMKWGNLMECVLFDLLGLTYKMTHKEPYIHPELGEYWSGSPDLISTKPKVAEIKSYEPLHFGKLSNALLTKDPEYIKENEPDVYWQVISNGMILGIDTVEIIAYMPYKSELLEIIKKVEETNFLEINSLNLSDYYFLNVENIESMPYLPDHSKFSNINSFEFEIPVKDKDFLMERMGYAINKLKTT